MIRDGVKSVAKQGCCHESLWPYITRLLYAAAGSAR